MKKIRLLITGLSLYLVLLFYLSGLNSALKNEISIESSNYIFTAFFLILIIWIQQNNGRSSLKYIAICITIYAIFKLSVPSSRPLLEGKNIFISVTEIVLLSVFVWIASHLSQQIHEVEKLYLQVILPIAKESSLPATNEALSRIQMEISRSRRNSRPFGVIVLEPEQESVAHLPDRLISEMNTAIKSRYLMNQLKHLVNSVLRGSDIILEQTGTGRLVIFCPETSTLQVPNLISRIKNLAAEHLRVSVSIGKACFPDESYTFEDLISKAESDMSALPNEIETFHISENLRN
jgi:GGDEF domain-containing protein